MAMPQSQATLQGPTAGVLMDRVTAVDPFAFRKMPAHGRARSLGSDQDHIDILRRDDARLIAVDDTEAVREVERFAGREIAA